MESISEKKNQKLEDLELVELDKDQELNEKNEGEYEDIDQTLIGMD